MPTIVLCTAALAVAVMYCSNDNVDPNPHTSYRPQLARGDGHMHFLITRSLVFDHDLDVDNDLEQFGDPWNQPRTVTGRKNVMQQIGPSLIWAPLLAVAHGCAVVANAFGADIPTHGYTLFHQRILFASSVVFAWLAVALAIAVARRLAIGRWAATYAAVAVLLGTTITYYSTYMPAYAHAMDAAACAIFLARWALTIGDLRWRRAIELGVWLGIAGMVRIQDWAFGIVLAMELAMLAWRGRDVRVLLRGVVALAIAVAMFAPQLYEWKQMYGSYLTTPQGPGQMRYAHPEFLELLFSPRDGWLSSHPIAYFGTLGLAIGVWRGPRLGLGPHVRLVCGALLAGIALQVYVNAVTFEWWSAASFGQRRMASSTLPLVIGLGVLLAAAGHVARRVAPRVPTWAVHAIAVVGLGYFVAWNLVEVSWLRGGRAAGHDRGPTCCDDMPAWLAVPARPVYAAIGNPFELPASAYFAVRYDVSLQRWDVANGQYALVPGVLGYIDGSYRRETATWNWTATGGWPWLLSGWDATAQKDGSRTFRWTTQQVAEGLLPTLMPEPHRVTMPIAANVAAGQTVEVVVRCNGAEVARTQVGPTWTSVTFDTDGTLGDNVIAIEAAPRPYAHGPPAPKDGAEVAVAVGPLRVTLPP
nr:hypothetical protein [Kofleriaceae bacterium]